MTKILVCSAGFGEGHNTAARNLCLAIDELGAKSGIQAEFVDILSKRHPRINSILTGGYLTILNRAPRLWSAAYRFFDTRASVTRNTPVFATLRPALARLLEETRPAAVVSTYPAYGYILDDLARNGGPSNFLRVTVVTDSISINSIWLRCDSNFYAVPNEPTAAALRRFGIPEHKIRVLGFPVHPRFAVLKEAHPRPDPGDAEMGRRVLYMINAGHRAAPALVSRLLEIDGIHLTVTAGKDERLRSAVQDAVAASGRHADVLGWTSEIPALMASHHILISKAGGATVQETIAAGCPMLMSQVAPGQEEGNAQLLLENESGRVALTPDATVAAVREAFANDAALCRMWMANINKLSRPDAARENAQFILDAMAARLATT